MLLSHWYTARRLMAPDSHGHATMGLAADDEDDEDDEDDVGEGRSEGDLRVVGRWFRHTI